MSLSEVIMSKKYYAVREGHKPGIYQTWDEAKAQIFKYSGATYKSFKTLAEAEMFMENKNNSTFDSNHKTDADTVIAYVDGSFDKRSERYSFGAALIQNNEVIHTLSRVGDNPKYQGSWQIAGEVFGALHAIQWAIQNNFKKIIIHYDYIGIEKWALGEWKTNKPVSQDYVEMFKKLAPKIEVSFIKVKAHSGVEFNELVDQLAKDALKNAPSVN